MLSGLELRDALVGAIVQGPEGTPYYVREAIGEGGHGWVFKASYGDPAGFWVVVKVLRPEVVDADTLQRFQREAEVLRRLASRPTPVPNIVRFYDYGQLTASVGDRATTLPFIVLEHVAGRTLADVIRGHGGFGLPIARVRRVMRQVARALTAMHELRIVHRDLKPSNVMLALEDRYEVAKVTDFGLVKLPDISANKTVSIAGASLGYAPPEQYELGNPRVGPTTDVFAFASVLYEMLSGRQAFPFSVAEGPLRLLSRMLSSERPTLARVSATVPHELRERPDLTAALDAIIGRALNADPNLRQATIQELWEETDSLLDRAVSPSPTASPGGAGPSGSPAPEAAPHRPQRSLQSGTLEDFSTLEDAGAPSAEPRRTSFRLVGRGLSGERLRSASIAQESRSIVAIGTRSLYAFANGVWSTVRLPAGISASAVRGMIRTDRGEIVLFGDGFASRHAPGTHLETERLPIDPTISLAGATLDVDGFFFVGARGGVGGQPSQGVVVEAPRGGAIKTRTLQRVARPRAVTRLAGGTFVVCGDHGALVELTKDHDERPVVWGRTGHLLGIAATLDGGAFAVGTGGHALHLSAPAASAGGATVAPVATLEPVQTTRDLSVVSLDEDGSACAAGFNGRLVQRRHGTWVRIVLDAASEARIIAVRARRDVITVLTEDGSVIEGRNL